jgi:hypothetical protein
MSRVGAGGKGIATKEAKEMLFLLPIVAKKQIISSGNTAVAIRMAAFYFA